MDYPIFKQSTCGGMKRSLLFREPKPNQWMQRNAGRDGSPLGGELELLARDAAQLEKTDQRFLDQVVRTRRTRGDTDDARSIRKPEVRNDFALLMQIVMLDLVCGDEARRVQDKIGGQFLFSHLREV